MKKLMLFVLAFALLVTGWNVCYAANGDTKQPDYAYTRVLGGETPGDKCPMYIRRVRYGMQGVGPTATGALDSIASGSVLVWDLVSNDGVTVSMYVVGSATAQLGIAGVAVTELLTQDAGVNTDISDDHYGYMAVGGWCLANVDISRATDGYTLIPGTDATLMGYFATSDLAVSNSQDSGVLLREAAADGKGSVYLKLQ